MRIHIAVDETELSAIRTFELVCEVQALQELADDIAGDIAYGCLLETSQSLEEREQVGSINVLENQKEVVVF